jgi:hypothetical protein
MPPDDLSLVRRARGGDRDAFASLARRHSPLLHATCRSAAGGDPTAATDLDADLDDERAAARIRRAIATLPPGQRDAVALFYLAGLTHVEDDDRTLPIWVGPNEASAIAGLLEGVELTRPGPNDFAAVVRRVSRS